MSIVLTQPQISSTGRKSRPIIAAEANEFIVVCPKCGTLETVWFTQDGLLVPTRKFSQYGARLYHDCGAGTPCHLYRTS
jgi:predicted nucleic-acid-binding Zn-ribbon protein